MVRKLASVLISLAVILPAWVQALGLGEIQLNSFLNQPLDAQIEIISSTRGESDGIQVKLAPADAFERSGLEFSNNLRALKFDVITKTDGRQYIKVTTQKGYREPFLNFLLEVNWANGRILREYSELVDPPSLVMSSPARTQAAAATQAPSTTTVGDRAPQPPLFGAPDRATDSKGFIGDTYTTKRNDTAWQIANDTRPDDQVSVEQSMMALLRANPDAFIRQNINRLKAGYVLNIPDRASMLSQSHADALADVRQQTREWQNRGRTQTTEAPKGRLEILPPQADATQASGSTAGGKDELHREVMLAREATEAQRQENSELRLRVSELEEQITNAKRLTQLKADQMAALEKKLAEINAAKSAGAAEQPLVEPETAPAEVAPAEEITEPAAETAVAEVPEAPADAVAAAEAAKNVVEAVPAKPGTPVNQNVVSGFQPVDIEKLPKSSLPDQPFKTGAEPGAVVEESAGLVDQVIAYFKQNPVIQWVVAGAGALLVLILGMLVVRRRRGDEQFEESILHAQAMEETSVLEETATAAETDATENLFETVDVDEATAEGKQDITDTSFLSDMVLSDMSDLQGEGAESDPLTEADVFLAYGRFGPAENMIKGAIEKEPERNDLRLKLLEVYYSSKNKDAFEKEAMAFSADLANRPDPGIWEKVVEMGEDLCPNHELFSNAAAVGLAATALHETDSGESVFAEDEEDTEIMDFDLSEFEDQIEKMDTGTSQSAVPLQEEDEGLDLDLGELMDQADVPEEDLENTMEITAELEGIADMQHATEEPVKAQGDITRRIVKDAAPVSQEITQELDIPDLTGLDLDYASDATMPMDEDLDMDDDALDDIDEVGTKLDLARAYIDMGDPEGARSILEEVMEEGDDHQKGEAEQLIKQI